MTTKVVLRKARNISVVVPCFNEQETIPELYRQLSEVCGALEIPYRLIFIDDGSVDQTWNLLSKLAAQDEHVEALRFSRNFGQQLAYRAGLDRATSDVVVTMDADLQDPPKTIPSLIQEWEVGADIVYAQRRTRVHDPLAKRFFATVFYRLIPYFTDFAIPFHVGEFRLIDRRVVEVIRTMNERRPFLRGMVAWTGFPSARVLYDRPSRHAGVTKFPFRKSLALATDALVGFSATPLRMALPLGLLACFLSVIGVGLSGISWYLGAFSSLIPCALWGVSLLVSLNLLFLGVLARYVAQSIDQSNSRPLYIVAETFNSQGQTDGSHTTIP